MRVVSHGLTTLLLPDGPLEWLGLRLAWLVGAVSGHRTFFGEWCGRIDENLHYGPRATMFSDVPNAYAVRNDQGYWTGIWNDRAIAESIKAKGMHGEKVVPVITLDVL